MKKYTFAKIASATALSLLPLTTHGAAAGIKIDALQGTPQTVPEIIKSITGVLFFAVGSIAVIMIIVGGLMYVLSAGDSGKASKAKDTILYAVVGVIITILSYAIVQFVVGTIK